MDQIHQPTQQIQLFREEVRQFLVLRKRSYNALKDNGIGEYFAISKQWLFKYKQYTNMDTLQHQGIDFEIYPQPDPLNQDLKLNVVQSKVFQYVPSNHHWNIYIQELNNPWEYEYMSKELYSFLESKYRSIGPIIRRGIFIEKTKQKQLYINLQKVTLIYKDSTQQLQVQYAQVDKNCTVGEWIKLLHKSFSALQLNDNLRLWLNLDQGYDEFISSLSHQNNQFDAKILDPNQLIGACKIPDYAQVYVEFSAQAEQWQLTEIDQKALLKLWFSLINLRSNEGCGKDVCTFKYCGRNPELKQLKLNKNQLAQRCINGIQKENQSVFRKICSMKQKAIPSLHAKELDQVYHITDPNPQNFEKFFLRIQEVFSDGDALKLSFLEGLFENVSDVYSENMITQEDPKVDVLSLQSINQFLLKYKLQQYPEYKQGIVNALNKVYPFTNKDLGSVITNNVEGIWELRGIFIILQFYFIYDEDILQDLFGFLNTIRNLKDEQKQTLSLWLNQLSEVHMQQCVEQIQQQLSVQLLQDDINQLTCSMAALKVTCIIEILQLFQRSNILFPRLMSQQFFNQQAENIYQDHQHQEEYLQFRAYVTQNYHEFEWTFCRWSWILSTEFKNKILSVESKVEQSQRVQRFHRQLLANPMELFNSDYSPHLVLNISRNDLIGSTLAILSEQGHKLKMPLKVHFEGEQGVDEGGVKREFFSLLVKQLFTPMYGCFVSKNNDRVIWFNSQSYEAPVQYELMGKLLGLALYNQVLLDIQFPYVVFKKLLNESVSLEDLKYLDPDLHKGLMSLRQYEQMDVEDSFCLTFSIQYEIWGQVHTDELMENGANIPVNQQNKEQYINLYVDWFLNKSIQKQFNLFYEGFKKVVDGEVIKLFTGEELCSLIIGSPVFDLTELASVTIYENGFHDKHPFIKDFWNFIFSLPIEQQKQFLFFVTGSDRVPIGGMKTMKFIIQKNGNGSNYVTQIDSELLPTAHTCFNVLLLPQYATNEKLKQKILKALNNAEGFGLF